MRSPIRGKTSQTRSFPRSKILNIAHYRPPVDWDAEYDIQRESDPHAHGQILCWVRGRKRFLQNCGCDYVRGRGTQNRKLQRICSLMKSPGSPSPAPHPQARGFRYEGCLQGTQREPVAAPNSLEFGYRSKLCTIEVAELERVWQNQATR